MHEISFCGKEENSRNLLHLLGELRALYCQTECYQFWLSRVYIDFELLKYTIVCKLTYSIMYCAIKLG